MSDVPDQIRESIEVLPVIAQALDLGIGAYEAASRAAAEAAGGDDNRYQTLLEATGAHELGHGLSVICGRIAAALGEATPRHYQREEATEMLAVLSAWSSS